MSVTGDMVDYAAEAASDATREQIARYLEYCSRTEIGAINLDGLFNTQQMMGVCASWVRNRLDVKWAAEMAAYAVHGTPYEHCVGCLATAEDRWQCPVRGCKMLPTCRIASGLHADDELCTLPEAHDGPCSHGIPRDA